MNFRRFTLPVIYSPMTNDGCDIYLLKAHSYTYSQTGVIGFLIYDYYIGGTHTVNAISINSDLTFGDKNISDDYLKRIAECLNNCSCVNCKTSFMEFMIIMMSIINSLYDSCEETCDVNRQLKDIFDFIEKSIQESIPDKEELIGVIIAGVMLLGLNDDYDDE